MTDAPEPKHAKLKEHQGYHTVSDYFLQNDPEPVSRPVEGTSVRAGWFSVFWMSEQLTNTSAELHAAPSNLESKTHIFQKPSHKRHQPPIPNRQFSLCSFCFRFFDATLGSL